MVCVISQVMYDQSQIKFHNKHVILFFRHRKSQQLAIVQNYVVFLRLLNHVDGSF